MCRRMIIVEDEETIRWALQELFMQDGWEVHGAADGDEAAGMIERSAYDFMITDLKMPGLSGVELVREARRRNPDIGVVVLTGYGSLETAIDAIRLRVWDYMTKPCNVAYMRQRIQEFFEHPSRQAASEEPHQSLTAEDFARFLDGEGTRVLCVSPLSPQKNDHRLLDGLRTALADLGFAARRAEEILQTCVEAIAALGDGAEGSGRAGLVRGHLLVSVSCLSPPEAGRREALQGISDQYKVATRVIESDGVYSMVLSEHLGT